MVGWIPSNYNLLYLLTKAKMIAKMRHRLVESIFYNKVTVIMEKDEN